MVIFKDLGQASVHGWLVLYCAIMGFTIKIEMGVGQVEPQLLVVVSLREIPGSLTHVFLISVSAAEFWESVLGNPAWQIAFHSIALYMSLTHSFTQQICKCCVR